MGRVNTTRVCSRCGERKDVETGFRRRLDARDGVCKACRTADDRAYRAELRENPVLQKAYTEAGRRRISEWEARVSADRLRKVRRVRRKRYWDKLKQDPERHARYLEDKRIRWRIARERRGLAVRYQDGSSLPAKKLRQKSDDWVPARLPIEKLLRVIEDELAGLNPAEQARQMGISERNYQRIRKGQQLSVEPGKFEAILIALGWSIGEIRDEMGDVGPYDRVAA